LAFNIITDVLIVLATALFVGELFEQFCLPSVVGEILGGIIIGPSLLSIVTTSTSIVAVSSIALFFIIFHIGFEMRTRMVRGKLYGSTLLAITSFVVPFIATAIITLAFFPFGFKSDLIIALAIAIPSISIISVLVLQYNLLNTVTGQFILSAVTISDVLAFILLAGIVRPLAGTLTIVLELAIFIAAYIFVDWLINRKALTFQRLLGRLSKYLRREDFPLVFLIIVALTFSVFFQSIGLTYVLGAFFAGLIVHDGLIGRKPFERISQTLSTMNRVFFIPIFFGTAGLEVMLQNIGLFFYVGLAVLIIAAMGIGIYLTFYVSKKVLQPKLDVVPRQISGVLAGKGAIGIVIATVALGEGAIDNVAYSLVILGTLVMSLAIPFFAGRMCRIKSA
jgi:Kef-type K+ transport system membrane component KefB